MMAKATNVCTCTIVSSESPESHVNMRCMVGNWLFELEVLDEGIFSEESIQIIEATGAAEGFRDLRNIMLETARRKDA